MAYFISIGIGLFFSLRFILSINLSSTRSGSRLVTGITPIIDRSLDIVCDVFELRNAEIKSMDAANANHDTIIQTMYRCVF